MSSLHLGFWLPMHIVQLSLISVRLEDDNGMYNMQATMSSSFLRTDTVLLSQLLKIRAAGNSAPSLTSPQRMSTALSLDPRCSVVHHLRALCLQICLQRYARTSAFHMPEVNLNVRDHYTGSDGHLNCRSWPTLLYPYDHVGIF